MRTIKWLGTTITFLFIFNIGFSQQLLLGKNPYALQKSAVLELNSDNQGLLFPRLADTVTINSFNPPDGMVIYFTPSNRLMVRTSGSWQALTPATILNNYVAANSAIIGATKTKITYDSKGLVIAGADATTSDIAEGSNLYHTDTRVRATTLTGMSTATATPVSATDDLLTGIGKLQGQINSLPTNTTALLKANNLSDVSNAGIARANLGGSTVGSNFFTLTNPSAVSFPRINADNTVSALTASTFRTAIGAGTGNGTVTSASIISANGFAGTVATNTTTPAITLSTTVTGMLKGNGTSISAATAGTDYLVPNASITGATKTKITYDSKGLVTSSADATTSDIAEGTNLYFTDARVRNVALTGLSTATATPITQTDNVLVGMGKLQGQINTISGAGYLTGNQNITLSGDISGSGTTGITTSIGANKVTLDHMAQVASGTFLGRSTTATGNVEALTTAQAKTMLGLTGNNTGDVALSGQNYLSLSGQTITVNPVDLSGIHTTGTLAAARFGALTGDVTNTAGSYNTTITNGAVTYSKMQNVSTNNRLLGRATAGAGSVEEIVLGAGLTLTGNTLSATASANQWNTIGNSGINPSLHFLGTTDDKPMILKSNNQSFLEFGNRGTLGLTQGYTDYDESTEKVTHIRSAMQFEAPAANFYKPKMYIDANGNFRIKGSSAGTDYFEMGSTGTANNGGFEFIIGDDGDEPIVFKSYHYVNGMSEIMRLQSGRMAVGSNAFDPTNPEKLLIDAGTTNSYNLMTGKGSIDNYLQINVQNRSAGGSASSDLVATANNGSETDKFIDMGINSGGYTNNSYPILGGANTTYLYGTGNDMVLGNGTASRNLRFFTGGFATTNERMRLDGSGNIGIANTAPTEKLDITGNLKFSGALMPGGTAGTVGQILQSNGAGAAPTWISPSSSSGWSLGGNNVSSLQRFGTTTNYDLPIITNNTEAMRITTTNRVGINTASPTETLDVNGNIKISGGNKRLLFAAAGGDPDAVIEHRTYGGTEINELLLYSGNDVVGTWGPDRIRMVGEEIRFQSFGTSNGTLAAAESETGTETRMIIDEAGSVGIGSDGFDSDAPEKLMVDAGITDSYNLIGAYGNRAGYLQFNIQNQNAGGSASTDIVATANNGTETANYINMGMNGGGYNNANNILSGPNNGYLFSAGRNFIVGNSSASYDMIFFTGGITNNNERMRILSGGNVGIGTSTPGEKLTVAGIIAPSADATYSLGKSGARWTTVHAWNGFIQTSDSRLKTNIKSLGYGLKEIMAMNPVRYNWKQMPDSLNKIGLIAQEVKQIIPEVVNGDEYKENLGMNYAELVPVLINAIKEQQKQIEELKEQKKKDEASLHEVDVLKQQMKELLDRVKQIEKK